jgi:hypothetical protein
MGNGHDRVGCGDRVPMTLPFKINYAIVCDQVRREDNGKLIIIGIYGKSILISEFPAVVPLSIATQVKPTQVGEVGIEFRVLIDGEEMVKGGAAVHFPTLDPAFLNLPNLPVQLVRPSSVRFEMREQQGRRWTTLAEIPVEARSPISSSAT